MEVAITASSGKTETKLFYEALERGYQVTAVCRNSSAHKPDEFIGHVTSIGNTFQLLVIFSDGLNS